MTFRGGGEGVLSSISSEKSGMVEKTRDPRGNINDRGMRLAVIESMALELITTVLSRLSGWYYPNQK